MERPVDPRRSSQSVAAPAVAPVAPKAAEPAVVPVDDVETAEEKQKREEARRAEEKAREEEEESLSEVWMNDRRQIPDRSRTSLKIGKCLEKI